MSRAAVRGLGAALALCTALLAGCTTGSAGGATSPPPSTPIQTPSSSPSPTVSSTPTSMTPTPTVTPTSSSPSASSTATGLPADHCTVDQLTMRLLPGGAEQGTEIAAVTFTNHSAKSCSLAGYPAVELQRGGKLLVRASPNTAKAAKLVHLGPGVQAEAQIRDHSTCQAPLSDAIHVVAPAPLTALTLNSTGPLVQMRGCTVTVDPIVLSS